MKLSQYAKQNGIGYRAAWSHFKKGWIPGAFQTTTGTVIIPDASVQKKEHVVCYGRVSSSENKSNLASQSKRLEEFCAAKGWVVSESIGEIGSGLNDNRKKLLKILADRKATRVVVEHKDRLTRFGFNYLKECCAQFNCEIVVINEASSDKEDLVQDFVAVITSFCARLYGQRRNKRKTEKLIQELRHDT